MKGNIIFWGSISIFIGLIISIGVYMNSLPNDDEWWLNDPGIMNEAIHSQKVWMKWYLNEGQFIENK